MSSNLKGKIHILIVDDSAFMRLLISDLLSSDDEIVVAGTASDGKEAVEKTLELKPDVVLLDMNMGDYDGLYAVEQIMKKSPRPILILSSVGNTNLNPIFDALRLGAVDYINKPKRGNSKIREINTEIIARVKKVARANPRVTTINEKAHQKTTLSDAAKPKYDVIVIGASTGGPSAVEKIITALPENLNVPVIIGQHMPQNFIKSFAARLDGLSGLKVVVSKRGMKIQPGTVIIASGESNMIVESDEGSIKVGYSEKQYTEYNHPSINALFASIAQCYGNKAIGVLLTGMGKDGVKGLGQIKDKGGKTVAQDESSSIIYGMPKLARDTGAAQTVLHIKEIGKHLINSL